MPDLVIGAGQGAYVRVVVIGTGLLADRRSPAAETPPSLAWSAMSAAKPEQTAGVLPDHVAENRRAPDEYFDFAISEYGAAIWCEPEAWLREAHRLLRPGGELVFLGNHPMLLACAPENGANIGGKLVRPYFGMHTLDWRRAQIDPGGVNFCLPVQAGWLCSTKSASPSATCSNPELPTTPAA